MHHLQYISYRQTTDRRQTATDATLYCSMMRDPVSTVG